MTVLATQAPNLIMVVVVPFSLLVLVCLIALALYLVLGRFGPPQHG